MTGGYPLETMRFPGESRGAVAKLAGAERGPFQSRYPNWAPAFAGEASWFKGMNTQ